LWQRFGRAFYPDGRRGVTEAEVEALFDEIGGIKMKPFFERYVRGTDDLPLAKLLAPFGVTLTDGHKAATPSLDVKIGSDASLAQVHEGGAAHRAGLSAGDVLVALDGLRVKGNPANLDALLGRYRVGDSVELHAFRRDELMTFAVTLQGARAPDIGLILDAPDKKAKLSVRPSAAG
jgi:predicted metalloprotease with PDZ domain